MYRTLAAAAAFAAICAPAFAGDVSISLAGKTKAQVIAEIRHAASSVCFQQGYANLDQRMVCVNEAEQDAMAQLAVVRKPAKSS